MGYWGQNERLEMTYQEFKEAVTGYAVKNGIADYELYYEGGWSDSVLNLCKSRMGESSNA